MRINREFSYWWVKPALSGLLFGLSRLPLHLGFLIFFAFIPLFSWLNESTKFQRNIRFGLIFSLLYTSTTLHWITLPTTSLVSGFWVVLAVGAGTLLGLYFLFWVYFSILFGLMKIIWQSLPRYKLFGFLCLWIGFEFIQNYGPLIFPWFNAGYSLANYTPLIQVAELGGVFLVSTIVIIVNMALYYFPIRPRQNIILLLILIALWFTFGLVRQKTLPVTESETTFGLVQPSIPQNLKWESSRLDSILILYSDMSEQAAESGVSLIIWPESAVPLTVLRDVHGNRFVKKLSRKLSTPIFTGFPHFDYAPRNHHELYLYYNAAAQVNPDETIDNPYYKILLVPFGERTPLLDTIPLLWNIQMGQANFQYGTKPVYYSVNGIKYSPLICFEILFPRLSRAIAEADFVINITNDAWFRRSAGPYQHSMMTKFRAVEIRRQFVRVANSGYSFSVSPNGKIQHSTKLFDKTVIIAPFIQCEIKTLFVRGGYWFAPVMGILGLILFVAALFKRYLNFGGTLSQ
ncbi:MAG: apolipoprotein N-acyltransferase [Candidatus Cloacimonetes bacterium]|nr:apolipoprotein N-acyltransferase [Candidatus Cloacimonadota bacterium]